MPAPNDQRRALLADTAIALLAAEGAHGLTHRAVERRAGLPTGTASNYFRTRDALFVAAAERVVALHGEHMDETARHERSRRRSTAARLTDLLTDSLLEAATDQRERYLAIFELRAESLRSPTLALALAPVGEAMARFTVGHHARIGLELPARTSRRLMTLYGGLLYTLVTEPPGTVDRASVQPLVAALVNGLVPRP